MRAKTSQRHVCDRTSRLRLSTSLPLLVVLITASASAQNAAPEPAPAPSDPDPNAAALAPNTVNRINEAVAVPPQAPVTAPPYDSPPSSAETLRPAKVLTQPEAPSPTPTPTKPDQPPNPVTPTEAITLRLSVNHHLAQTGDLFTFTVEISGPNSGLPKGVQIVIAGDDKSVSRVPVDADGRARVGLKPGAHVARAEWRSTPVNATYDVPTVRSNDEFLTVVDLQLKAPTRVDVGKSFELSATLGDGEPRGELVFDITPRESIKITPGESIKASVNGHEFSATHEPLRKGTYTLGATLLLNDEKLKSAVQRLTVVAPAATKQEVTKQVDPPKPPEVTTNPPLPPEQKDPNRFKPKPSGPEPPLEPPMPRWPMLIVVALSLLTIGGGGWLIRKRIDRRPKPSAPDLTCNTQLSHTLELHSPPRIHFRLTARAVPDHGRQTILPPSTPAPKLEDAHGQSADHP